MLPLHMIGRYGGERVADTLVSLHTIIRFFSHYFRILPQNPHYITNILINYRQSGCGFDDSMWKIEQLNSPALVGEVTSRAEP